MSLAIINTRHTITKEQVQDLRELGYLWTEICEGDLGNFNAIDGIVTFTETTYTETNGKRVATNTRLWTLKQGEALVWSVPAIMQASVYPLLIKNEIRPITPLTERRRTGVDSTGKPVYDHVYVGLMQKIKFISEDELIAGKLPQSQR